MDEAGMWESLRNIFQIMNLDAVRVENPVNASTPDVNYLNGWLELKFLAEWPKRPNTPVRIQKLIERPGQVAWLVRRWTAGAPAYLMLRVDRELLLFAAPDARAVRAGLPREELEALAVWRSDAHGHWQTVRTDWLRSWLTWEHERLPINQRARFLRLRCGWSVTRAADELAVRTTAILRGEAEACQLSSDLVEAYLC